MTYLVYRLQKKVITRSDNTQRRSILAWELGALNQIFEEGDVLAAASTDRFVFTFRDGRNVT